MDEEPWIDVFGHNLPLDSIPGLAKETGLTSHEKKVVDFCKDWVNGKKTFEITTSGSTGDPKKIILHRDQMIASANKTARALGLRRGMTALVCIDPKYIGGMMMLVRALEIGMNIIVPEEVTSTPFKDIALDNARIDFTALVPYQVMNSRESEFQGKIIIGGALVTPELQQKVKMIDHAIFYATFGMTETLSHIALQKLNGLDGHDAQDHFYTLDGVEVKADERQCLVITADHLSDTIVTNDIVDIINSHEFKWIGRYDNVINSGGVKIMPEKIEKAIGDYGLNLPFFVTGIPHGQLGQQVVLVIEGMLMEEAQIRLLKHLKDNMDRYEVPRQVLYSNRFVLTLNGKINRTESLKNALPRPSLLR